MFSNLQQKGNQGLLKPIGCTFDEQNRHWIVCDTGRNVVCLEKSNIIEEIDIYQHQIYIILGQNICR
jgi:hypothetical protein